MVNDLEVMAKSINTLILDGMDENNISSILVAWNKSNKMKKLLEELNNNLKVKVRVFMKEKRWDRYLDKDTKINVSLDRIERETIDKEKLRLILTQQQMQQVTKFTTTERLSIMGEEQRKKIKKFLTKL